MLRRRLALQRPASLPTALPRQPQKVVQIALIKPTDAAVHLIFRSLVFCYIFAFIKHFISKSIFQNCSFTVVPPPPPPPPKKKKKKKKPENLIDGGFRHLCRKSPFWLQLIKDRGQTCAYPKPHQLAARTVAFCLQMKADSMFVRVGPVAEHLAWKSS